MSNNHPAYQRGHQDGLDPTKDFHNSVPKSYWSDEYIGQWKWGFADGRDKALKKKHAEEQADAQLSLKFTAKTVTTYGSYVEPITKHEVTTYSFTLSADALQLILECMEAEASRSSDRFRRQITKIIKTIQEQLDE